MTTVASTLKIFDVMSKPLKNITSGMNLMISTMHEMQSATNKNVNIDKSLKLAKQQIASAEASINAEIERAAKAQEQFNKRTRESNQGAKSLLSTIKTLGATYLTFSAGRTLYERTVGEAMNRQNILDTLAARTGSVPHGQAIFDAVTKQALKYGQDVNAALAGSQSFMSATLNPKTITELNMLAMRLSKLNPTEGLEGAVFSLKELLSGDYTSISERFNISRSMLKDSEARAAGLRGDVEGFIKGMDKLLNQQNMTQAAFEKMLDTPSAKWNKIIQTLEFKLGDAGMRAAKRLGTVFDKIYAIINSKSFDQFINGLSVGLKIIVGLFGGIVDGVSWFAQVVRTNGPIISVFFAALLTYLTILGLRQIPLLVAKLWLMVPPILAQAGAWMMANWPILLVVAAVGLLIAALMHFGVSAQEAIGFVIGLFYSLYAVIYNQFALLWNLVASYAEFLINVFIDPTYAVKKLFYDLAMTFGNYMYNMTRSAEDFAGNFMKTILRSINKTLEGFNWLVDKVNDMFGTDFGKAALFDENNIHAVSDSLKKIMDTLEKPVSNKNVVSFERMQQKNLKDSFDTGYKAGFNVTDKALGKLSNAFKGIGTNSNGFSDFADNISNIDKVGEVGKIKDKVDISSEDIKLMRELAEMKSIQNFVTYTPTVSVTTGPVSKDVDIDEVVARIEQALEEDLAANAAGVYA
ncbi:hypothetical protein [Neobacillus sp.]|uniref:hypothetical protein n=1 Tax=Neobacillus sp. TaxID=2675273 RepID=UPI0035B5091A